MMIDERNEALGYLDGMGLNADNLYRMCWLLICLYKEQGLTPCAIRDKLFEWGKKHRVWIKYDVNSIITRVFDAQNNMLRSPIVKVSKQDVERIKKSYFNKKVRLVALAMLLYAKAYANKKKEFYISSVGLGAWLGISRKTLRGKYIKELVDFEYLVEVEARAVGNEWNKEDGAQSIKYRLNVPLYEDGEYEMEGNDIYKLYNEAFT
jgi:hypothetical protein